MSSSAFDTTAKSRSADVALLNGASGPTSGFVLTSALVRRWGTKSVLSLIDQALTSGAGFGVNLLLARWLPGQAYGAFAVAFTMYLFISGFHNVLLLEPLSVIGPARYPTHLSKYFRAQLEVHSLLVWPLSGLILLSAGIASRVAPLGELVGALVGGGIALPFLLLLWLARRMCYVLQRPLTAILGSGLYLAFAVGALALLHNFGRLSPLNVFVLSGAGSLVGAFAVFYQLGLGTVRDQNLQPISWRTTLVENWTYGRWLVGSTVLFSISNQTQTFLVAALLGLGAAGILRATQLPSLVMSQVVTATGLLVLPVFSYDFGQRLVARMRRRATSVSLLLGAAALCFVALLAVFARGIERLLYEGKYSANAWLIPLLALVPVANAISTGYSAALRAAQKAHFDLIANSVTAPVCILSAIFFVKWWGLAGAAASMAFSAWSYSVVTGVLYKYWFGRRTALHAFEG